MISGVEYFPCCIGIFDVASQKQTEDVDSHNICMCWDCCNHAIYYKVCSSTFIVTLFSLLNCLRDLSFFSDIKTGLIYFKSINLKIQKFGRPNLCSFLITFEPVNLASFSHNKLSTNPI